MVCPLCDYVMDPFDTVCRKCKGQGLKKSEVPAATAAPPPPIVLTAEEQATMNRIFRAPDPTLKLAAAPAAARPSDLISMALGAAPANATATSEGQVAEDLLANIDGTMPCFFALRTSTLGKSVYFRVYIDDDALLFLEAGTWHVGLIASIKQMYGETDSGMAAKVLGQSMGRLAAQGGAVGGAIGLAAGGMMWVASKNLDNLNRKQADMLDALTQDGLRERARSGGNNSLYLTRASAAQVVLRPSARLSLTDSPQMAGYFSFQHVQMGRPRKWDLVMMTLTDCQLAALALRKIIGSGAIITV